MRPEYWQIWWFPSISWKFRWSRNGRKVDEIEHRGNKPDDPLASIKSNFRYFLICFLTIIYKKQYKKQRFLIQFAKLDTFPGSTQNFSKNLFGHFRPFFTIIWFFWPFQIVDLPQNINFHPTKKFWKPVFRLQTPLFLPNFHHPLFSILSFSGLT